MALFSPYFKKLVGGDPYTLPTPDSSLICDCFTFKGFMYLRTPTKYLTKPVHKHLWKTISRSEYEYQLSAHRTDLNRSQAKGLLKYTQLEFDL